MPNLFRGNMLTENTFFFFFFSFSKDVSLTQVVFTLYAAVLAIWRQAGCCTYSVLKLNVMNDLKLPSDGN